jgi:hypothetical protein
VARLPAEQEAVPENLARFVLGEWPGGTVAGQTHRWGVACRAWLAGHPGMVLPHSADPIDCYVAVIAERERLAAAGITDPPHPRVRIARHRVVEGRGEWDRWQRGGR